MGSSIVTMCSWRLSIDLVDDRSQGGRFAAAGGTGHQDQPPRLCRQFGDDGRKIQFLEGQDLVGNHSEDPGHGPALDKDITPETGKPLDAEGEVKLVLLLELVLLGIGQHAVAELLGLHPVQGREIERGHLAVNRIWGGVLVVTCRSDPFCSTRILSN